MGLLHLSIFFRLYYIINDFANDALTSKSPTITSIFVFSETIFGLIFSIIQLGVVTERILATSYANSYENQGYASTIIVLVVPWAINLVIRVALFVNLITQTSLSYAMLVSNFVTWTVGR